MPKRKTKKVVSQKQIVNLNVLWAGQDMSAGHLNMLDASVELYNGRLGSCIQCIEFAIQNLESAKAKLML